MKYVVILCDGMADYPIEALGGKTPMAAAQKPQMDKLAKNGRVGLVKTVADGLKPGSDVANLSVLGYDPAVYYSGRSPLEAASIGIDLKDTDVTLRCNLVTLSDDEADYRDKTILDYCADDIHSDEAALLVADLQKALGSAEFRFYSGVSYRHCLVWENGTTELGELTPPHDITGKPVAAYLPAHPNAQKLLALMEKSYPLLKDHPVNRARITRGLRPANSIWLWGAGKKKALAPFEEKFGLKGAMISAVDLLRGIGTLSGMDVIRVPGATGYIDTNFDGKAAAAVTALKNGYDFVYVHIEAPDECGHRGEVENKVKAIELIDRKILTPLLCALENEADYKIMILPDHATPLPIRTHTGDPVPFLIYQKRGRVRSGVSVFDEAHAAETKDFVPFGPGLIEQMIRG